MHQALPLDMATCRVQSAICWKPRVSGGTACHTLAVGFVHGGSDNPSGAGNQQERPGIEQWVVGFVDGEGCFSISVVRNPGCLLGWQVQHEFSVTQAAPSRPALELVQRVFGCGQIVENRRHDNHRHPLLRFSVKRRRELIPIVVPFFEQHPLITAKRADFVAFASVLRMMEDVRTSRRRGYVGSLPSRSG